MELGLVEEWAMVMGSGVGQGNESAEVWLQVSSSTRVEGAEYGLRTAWLHRLLLEQMNIWGM